MAVLASTQVRRSPEVVFRHIEDPALAARWQLGVMEQQVTHQEPGLVGTRFRQRVGDDRYSIELHGEITDFVPGRVLEVRVTGRALRSRIRYEVAPDPAGTRVDVVADVRMGGPFSLLLSPFTRRRTLRQLRAELARLTAVCEHAVP